MRRLSTPWNCSSDAVLKDLESDAANGLSEFESRERKKKFGPNHLRAQPRLGRWSIFIKQFKNPMAYTLLTATALALGLGHQVDAFAILMIIALNALIGFFQESKAEAAIDALKKLSVPSARVLRTGRVEVVASVDVVPGDILVFEAGDYVIADARVLDGFQLSVDESILTGESLPVSKTSENLEGTPSLAERRNCLFAGTAISSGSGRAVVFSTGMETELGRIAELLHTVEAQATPLQLRLERVNRKLLFIGLGVIASVIVLGFLHQEPLDEILMAAISLAVAAIPEGLPTVVTLALALAVRRMTKRNALIRRMNAVESLGSTDVICSDKTGTLTSGRMEVRQTFTLDAQHEVQFHEAMVLCNNASLEGVTSGDTTEIALLRYCQHRGIDPHTMRGQHERLHEWSFESRRKRMTVAVRSSDKIIAYTKGAPESLLPRCAIAAESRELIQQTMDSLTSTGHRVLALAWKPLPEADFSDISDDEVERDLLFLGLVAMADPPKPESRKAIALCRRSGIKVVMITGDHPRTARAIATELGIEEGPVLTGKELESLPREELRSMVESTHVYARVSPEHKLIIIDMLQSNGHVVAMTGDGVNDAPALKKASVGISMGRGGTEVARQASAIVLTDDDFSTIVAAIEEGRAIFGNIKRTIQFLLSTNLAEIWIMFGAVAFGFPVPVEPLALLWINLVTDGLPSLALAAEPVPKDFLQESQGPSPASFFSSRFIWELVIVAGLITAIELGVYLTTLQTTDLVTARSYAFSLLVYLCVFRSISCRSDSRPITQLPPNWWHSLSLFLAVFGQIILQEHPIFTELFRVRALAWIEHAKLLGLALLPVVVLELSKLFRHHRPVGGEREDRSL